MIPCKLDGVSRILCLGAHADDIEIGCGGTLLRWVRERPNLEICWVVFSARGDRKQEARASARAFLKGNGKHRAVLKDFKDGFFPSELERIKQSFEELKGKIQPDVVFTHYREDRHQDHRVLSDLTWNTFRNHMILEYEIPKYDGDLGAPNCFVELQQDLCLEKTRNVCAYFQTQSNKHWMSADTFMALMRLRGMECACGTKYAEAFYCRKLVLK